MGITLDRQTASDESRLVLVSLCTLTMRLLENWRESLASVSPELADCETTMIIGAIIAIGGERLIRSSADQGVASLSNALPVRQLARCNISSIAVATGIQRETVRRRINRLVSEKIVVRDSEDGIAIVPELQQLPWVTEVLCRQIAAVGRAVDQLSRLKVIR